MPQSGLVLLQLELVVSTAALLGWLARRLRQPAVVGEMIAGLLLGPTLFGRLFPKAYDFCFNPENTDALYFLSRFGIWLFLFLVGLELDLAILRKLGRSAITIGNLSILVPFFGGFLLAPSLYARFGDPHVPILPFALFVGAAMSVTAFPVLARILKERGWSNTPMGTLAIACAAMNDLSAWCILAAMMVLVGNHTQTLPIWWRFFLLAVYIVVMLTVVRRFLQHHLGGFAGDTLAHGTFCWLLLGLFFSCTITQLIGVHALFGAFIFGIALPKAQPLEAALRKALEPLATVLLLPVFFAYTGLRADLHMIHGVASWGYAAIVIVVAVCGKFAGAALPARVLGHSWSESGVLGTLLNTRGLMELVILNVGLELGIIRPELFSILVLMAIVTTLMASPLLDWLKKGRAGLALASSPPGS